MSKSCGHKRPCGCEDQPLTTNPPCETGTSSCPTPDPCPETFALGCVVYTGDTIVDLGITNGERLDVILQRLTLWLTNPGCITPGFDCQAVLGFQSSNITSTSVDIAWLAAPSATGYSIEYKLASALTWNITATTANTYAVLGMLTPNSDYQIRVNAICPSGTCFSVTIQIKTKP